MFAKHQLQISQFARANPENFAKVMQFVIITIRNPLYNVASDIETATNGGEEAMGVLFGYKFEAYNDAYLRREAHFSYCEFAAMHNTGDELACAIIEYVAAFPGFDIPKAGFVAQLIYGVGGCLDTHNLKRFGFKPSAFRNFKQRKTAKARRNLVAKYVKACNDCGGAEHLWNSWCEYVATQSARASVYRDAYHVSSLHVEALNI